MPYLGRRVRENFLLFFLMGVIYYLLYHNKILPGGKWSITISYAGVIVVALFIYVYFLHTYLMNIADLRDYTVVNLCAYLIYFVVYYIAFIAFKLFGGVFRQIYAWLFAPFDLFCVLGMGTVWSSILVHLIFIATIWIVPMFAWDNSSPYDMYLNEEEEL